LAALTTTSTSASVMFPSTALSCMVVGSTGMTSPANLPLRRDSRNKVIGGVCAGIARRLGMSRNGLRLAFVLSCVLPGPQFIAYVLLWLLIPAD
jgi:phage shock protein PspC (stress-responsive transcriptional regulator)